MDRRNIAVMDVETGGLDCTQCATTQVAIVGINTIDFTEIVAYQAYIKPYGMRYDQKALDYTGTTKGMLEEKGKPIDQVAKEVVNVLEQINTAAKYKNRNRPMVAGHNVRFDIGFIGTLLIGSGFEDLSKYLHGGKDAWGNFQPSALDTWDLAICKYGDDPEKKKFNLETVCQYEGVDIVDAHDALNDTRATAQALISFLSSMRSNQVASPQIQHKTKRPRYTFQI